MTQVPLFLLQIDCGSSRDTYNEVSGNWVYDQYYSLENDRESISTNIENCDPREAYLFQTLDTFIQMELIPSLFLPGISGLL
jgi:hypothetical protein